MEPLQAWKGRLTTPCQPKTINSEPFNSTETCSSFTACLLAPLWPMTIFQISFSSFLATDSQPPAPDFLNKSLSALVWPKLFSSAPSWPLTASPSFPLCSQSGFCQFLCDDCQPSVSLSWHYSAQLLDLDGVCLPSVSTRSAPAFLWQPFCQSLCDLLCPLCQLSVSPSVTLYSALPTSCSLLLTSVSHLSAHLWPLQPRGRCCTIGQEYSLSVWRQQSYKHVVRM